MSQTVCVCVCVCVCDVTRLPIFIIIQLFLLSTNARQCTNLCFLCAVARDAVETGVVFVGAAVLILFVVTRRTPVEVQRVVLVHIGSCGRFGEPQILLKPQRPQQTGGT